MRSFIQSAYSTVKDLQERLDQSFDDALRGEQSIGAFNSINSNISVSSDTDIHFINDSKNLTGLFNSISPTVNPQCHQSHIPISLPEFIPELIPIHDPSIINDGKPSYTNVNHISDFTATISSTPSESLNRYQNNESLYQHQTLNVVDDIDSESVIFEIVNNQCNEINSSSQLNISDIDSREESLLQIGRAHV